jgi:hypothetical protein
MHSTIRREERQSYEDAAPTKWPRALKNRRLGFLVQIEAKLLKLPAPFSVGIRKRSMLMPRGKRPSTAALTSWGARKASESVIPRLPDGSGPSRLRAPLYPRDQAADRCDRGLRTRPRAWLRDGQGWKASVPRFRCDRHRSHAPGKCRRSPDLRRPLLTRPSNSSSRQFPRWSCRRFLLGRAALCWAGGLDNLARGGIGISEGVTLNEFHADRDPILLFAKTSAKDQRAEPIARPSIDLPAGGRALWPHQ